MLKPPFEKAEFLDNIAAYNDAMWPLQVAALAVCLVLAMLAWSRRGLSLRAALIALGTFWLWNGLVFHLQFHSRINPAGVVFAGFFALQGAALLWTAWRADGSIRFHPGGWSWVASALLVFALALYPLIGLAAGHQYPVSPIIGLAPCPTTIFTIGLMLLAVPRLPKALFVLPLLWSLIGWNAVWLGMYEDFGLLASGLVALIYMLSPAPQARARQAPTIAPTA